MSAKFVVSHLDQQLGPFLEQELKAKWAKGELLPIDYVYDEAKKDWILLAERFEWAAVRGEGAPPPLKPSAEKKKTPPAAPVQLQVPLHTGTATQQKPAEATIVIHTPIVAPPAALPEVDLEITNAVRVSAIQKPAPRGAEVKIVNGVGELDLSNVDPGQVELVLHSSNLKTQEPLKIQVRSLEPDEITWSYPPQPTVGSEFEIVIKAVDSKGTVCNHFSEEFSIRVGGSEPRELPVHLRHGQAVLKIANTKAEPWELSLHYKGTRKLRLPESKSIEWMPGPAARLILDGPPDLVAGNPLKVQVKAVDQYGNLARTFQGTVTLEVKAS